MDKLYMKRFFLGLLLVIVLTAVSLLIGMNTIFTTIIVLLIQLVALFIILYGVMSSITDLFKHIFNKNKEKFDYMYAVFAVISIAVFVIFLTFYMQTVLGTMLSFL